MNVGSLSAPVRLAGFAVAFVVMVALGFVLGRLL